MAAAIAAPATMLCTIQNLLDEDSEEHIDIFVYGCPDCSSLALVDLISNHYILGQVGSIFLSKINKYIKMLLTCFLYKK
jgi:hypothetical protein